MCTISPTRMSAPVMRVFLASMDWKSAKRSSPPRKALRRPSKVSGKRVVGMAEDARAAKPSATTPCNHSSTSFARGSVCGWSLVVLKMK